MRRILLGTAVLVAAAVAAVAYLHETKPPSYARVVYPLEYEHIIRSHARNYRLEPELIAAVIYQESKFNPRARSSSGAVGLMQLRPDTAHGIAARTGGAAFRTEDLLDPEINVRYGSWYLDHLRDRYGDTRLVLAAYHAGQGNVDDWLERGGEIEFPQTREYVDEVTRLRGVYAKAYDAELGPR
jgi:soluble lytic murein transglycosylase